MKKRRNSKSLSRSAGSRKRKAGSSRKRNPLLGGAQAKGAKGGKTRAKAKSRSRSRSRSKRGPKLTPAVVSKLRKRVTPSVAARRLSMKRWKRKSNPLGLRLGNPTGNWGNIAALSASAFAGYVATDFLDRFVATRAGGKAHKDEAFTGLAAVEQISAPPDGMRLAAQAGVAILFAVGGFWAAKKSYPTVAYAATGAAIGSAIHLGAQIWNDSIVPSIAKPSGDAKNPGFLGDRIYPDLDKKLLDALADKAKAGRADGHPTLGAPQRSAPQAQRPAPQAQRPTVSGPQGQPRVVARPAAPAPAPAPAPALGCGVDDFNRVIVAQLQKQNKDLQDQVAALRAGVVASGPETINRAAAPAAPPAGANTGNVTSISQRFARFA